MTGSVAECWAAISAWLQPKQPQALDQFNPPAAAAAIAATQSALGVSLHSDYQEFLFIHDGQDELASWVGLGALVRIVRIADVTSDIFGEMTSVGAVNVSAGIQPVDCHLHWIPISKSLGQSIEYVADVDIRPRIANSFAE